MQRLFLAVTIALSLLSISGCTSLAVGASAGLGVATAYYVADHNGHIH